ncbi:2-oxo acid dehydrogenase subunit E2 [Saccharopolyspora sp. HNM0983]|uniref:Dihydrolipoamide acetyltransferase component of pyruvate dehydrogenase complex n=1 Tax=Saccharopolyspora montiporae TaxID=2781240 RepID=A0A929B6N1_9PSEU|nr:dihydrolipoamide acetyltransferase family protein [Saccharopolyspora sp. HNM0983]MBE9373215.1 2-oxo acid dehydrogenase subunit E2 [Saccharopolyspora sp. HNM0983]
MTEIQMPRLSDTMEEGVIATWHKQVGDTVERGDVVAEIETDKAIMELEAFDAGVLEKILLAEGATVPIGTPIAVLGDGSGAAAESAEAPAAAPAEAPAAEPVAEGPAAESAAEPVAASAEPAAGRGVKPKASPLAKRVAKEQGVDLAQVRGTGPGGRIIRVDIEAAAQQAGSASSAPAPQDAGAPAPAQPAPSQAAGSQSAADPDVEEIPLGTIRKVTAKRLTESKQQAPHFYLTSAIDVTDLVAFRAELNQRLQAADGPKVSLNDLVVKAVATALRANPSVNVSFGGDTLLQHKRIHLGVAVAIEGGLVVPVITDTDRKSVSEIAAEGRELAGRARDGKLKADEMSGGTFTISNLGMFGVEQFSAVINPPEAGILAVGAVDDEVKVREGEFVARKIMRVTLSADHRAVDGAVGAAFLQQLTGLLEDPLRIIA